MSIIDRLRNIAAGQQVGQPIEPEPAAFHHSSLGLTPLYGGPIPSDISGIRDRIDEIPDDIAEAEANARGAAIRIEQADAEVSRLTQLAREGKLRDAAKLTAALKQQAQLRAQGEDAQRVRINMLHAERDALQDALHAAETLSAEEAYEDAIEAFAKAVAPLLPLADRLIQAAANSHRDINSGNSSGVPFGGHLVLGGRTVNLRQFA